MSYSWDNRAEDYRTFLGRRAVLDEQLQGLKGAASDICAGISAETQRVLGSVDSMTSVLSTEIGTLSAGIESGLGHVSGVLEEGFAGLLRSSDEIKQELKRLVELVEFEEQRKAMENFRYAVFAMHRGLWEEALDYVTAAIEGDEHSKGYRLDWHFHWVKGELLLGSPARHDWMGLNPVAAEQAFLLAARYAKADSPDEAARSLLMASVAAYAQSHEAAAKLDDMRRHAEAAHALDPDLAQAAFQFAKAEMALDAPDAALPLLRKAIDGDISFAIRAAEDPDHRRHAPSLNRFFETLRQEKAREVAERARAASESTDPIASKLVDFASEPAVRRLCEVAGGSSMDWPLIELLEYGASGLDADRDAAETLKRAVLTDVERARAAVAKKLEEVAAELQVELTAANHFNQQNIDKQRGVVSRIPTPILDVSIHNFWKSLSIFSFALAALPLGCGACIKACAPGPRTQVGPETMDLSLYPISVGALALFLGFLISKLTSAASASKYKSKIREAGLELERVEAEVLKERQRLKEAAETKAAAARQTYSAQLASHNRLLEEYKYPQKG